MQQVTTGLPGAQPANDKRPSPLALLFAPDREMPRQAKVGRTLGMLLFVWVCALLLASALALRVEAGSSTLRALDKSGELKNMSDRQLADETQKAERIFQVKSLAKGVLVPPIDLGLASLAVLGLCWFLKGRIKGRAVAPVAVVSLVPGGIANLVDAVTVARHAAIPPEGVALSPRTLSDVLQLVGHPLTAPWVKLGNALDFFSLWAAVLMAFGVMSAGQLPRRRAVIGTLIAWVCYRLLTHVAIGT